MFINHDQWDDIDICYGKVTIGHLFEVENLQEMGKWTEY